jgi:hypothetical protein
MYVRSLCSQHRLATPPIGTFRTLPPDILHALMLLGSMRSVQAYSSPQSSVALGFPREAGPPLLRESSRAFAPHCNDSFHPWSWRNFCADRHRSIASIGCRPRIAAGQPIPDHCGSPAAPSVAADFCLRRDLSYSLKNAPWRNSDIASKAFAEPPAVPPRSA